MTDSEDFDDIVNNQDEDTSDPADYWDHIIKLYNTYNDGIFRTGLFIMDRVDGNGERELVWIKPPDSPTWEIKALAQQVVDDLNGENMFQILAAMRKAEMEAEAEEEEDDDE